MKNLKKLLVFLSVCVFILAVCQGQGLQKKNPRTIIIKILVENEKVICDPDPAYARYEDTVKWKCKYAFEVDFGKETPFEKEKYKADKQEAKDGKGDKVTYKIAEEAVESKRFKYSVAVDYNGETLTVDPDLEIQR